jgi:hypothetical protein
MYFDSCSDFVPLCFIGLTLWLMRARFTSRIDTPWPMVYYFLLVIFIRYNEGEFNNNLIFAGIICALFLRFEFMAGMIMKMFRTGEFVVHLYILIGCFAMLTRA